MDYIEAFRNLKPNTKYSRKSPQKAILLLAIIDMFDDNILQDNEIKYNETLKKTFLKVWHRILTGDTTFPSEAYLPFWYMQSEEFWHVVPVRGKENFLSLVKDEQISPSEANLYECVRHVELDEDLYFMLTMPSGRSSLKRALLETYSELSPMAIDSLSESSDNSTDSSAMAMSKYKEMLDVSEKGRSASAFIQKGDNILIFAQLDEDIQITFNLEYYKFLKNHRQEREMFKEMCPTVEELYKNIVVSQVKQDEICKSLATLYDNFLCDLKIALMGDDGSIDIIDKIDEALVTLRGETPEELETEEYEDTIVDVDNESINTFSYSDVNEEKTGRKSLTPAGEIQTGKPWTKDEERKISTLYQLGYPIEDISVAIGRTEASIKKHLTSLGLMDYVFGEERGFEKVEVSNNDNEPVDFFIENSSTQGSIYNILGSRVFTISGQLKLFHGKPYRFNYKDVCFTVKDLVRNGDAWDRGVKQIVAYPDSDLFSVLKPNGFINQIQDLVECQRWEDNKIKVDGKWYDNEGYYLNDAEEAETDQLLLDSSCESSECELEGKLKAFDKVAQNAYDYLWLISIVEFMGEKQQSSSLSYDSIACMMIANAWEILNAHPELRVHEWMLSECIEFLIEESKEYMDEELTWSSSKDDVFDAIKDYPMAGIFEDTVEELVESAPYNILKAWIKSEDKQELIVQSNDYKNACLYAILPRKIDPYIEINPKLTNYLLLDHVDIIKYLIEYLIASY